MYRIAKEDGGYAVQECVGGVLGIFPLWETRRLFLNRQSAILLLDRVYSGKCGINEGVEGING